MRASVVRYLALGVLVVGLAAIAWTGLRGDDPGEESAASLAGTGDVDQAAGTGDVDQAAGTGDVDRAAGTGDVDRAAGTGAGDEAAGTGADDRAAGTGADDQAVATPPSSAGSDAAEEAAEESAVVATGTVAAGTVPPEPVEVLGTADTLTNLDGWLNTDATSLEEIRAANALTVVQFWTFGCRNCKNTLEALSQLYADFRDQGVEIVGVHSPEFSYEADIDNIIEASADLGVIWPIALDTDKRNFHRWQEGNIGYWPRVYVIDGDNRIRFDRKGDGRATYAQLYETVERLLAEA